MFRERPYPAPLRQQTIACIALTLCGAAAGHNNTYNLYNVCTCVRAAIALMIFIYLILLIMRAIKEKHDKT